ncbi:putative baseplate assembly protein [Mesorhizobium japonicum]|uniref:Mlr6564 protein n=1 Tax=Mesorhizobium japonicum (strain LMG 29417 / CECT 9101 / MAFF 303099) TaxID=266835 RepID=Q988W6_RHILO|nr:putative baseplate assembly protein [Mesorhizobium japonicum]BAB52831.1 mlr6564 [Mesorhizobium japonicum MAFF 303099]
MSQLAPVLFTRRYSDLVEIGLSRLPSLSPDWTDHNAHDPGISLIELLAWVAEAEIYALARSRRDERLAYAALMGFVPNGARPAQGLIWPDHDSPDAPEAMFTSAIVIERDQVIHTVRADQPSFRPLQRILWLAARVVALTTRLPDGSMVDHSGANRRGSPAFQPFGAADGRGVVLAMTLEATGAAPLFWREPADDARLVIGVRAAGGQSKAAPAAANSAGSPLEVTLVTPSQRVPLRIVEDTTGGFLRTGFCSLDVSAIRDPSTSAILEFRLPRGFDRAPGILRIEPNVIPITQSEAASEIHVLSGAPNQGFDLEYPGLEFEPGAESVKIEVEAVGGFEEWKRCDRLSDQGPQDRVFQLDPVAARISFGNGINGTIPPSAAQIRASYSVSQGMAGNTAANRKWLVFHSMPASGVNPDPIAGGEDPSGWLEQRRQARQSIAQVHPLVSVADIEAAALALPDLEVGRAWLVPARIGDVSTETIRLVAMQSRLAGAEPRSVPETARWLEAVRRALVPRMSLGARLAVVAPRYVDFTIRARIVPEPRLDVGQVKRSVVRELTRRLALVGSAAGQPLRAFGLAVTRRDLVAWLQALPDVRHVADLQVMLAGGKAVETVKVPRTGLPHIDLGSSEIDIALPAEGATR